MDKQELQSQTVLQLRKIAKENGVKLSAGISKEGIVERIYNALTNQRADEAEQLSMPIEKETVPAQAEQEPAESVKPEQPKEPERIEPTAPANRQETLPAETETQQRGTQPVYHSAWSNPNIGGQQNQPVRYNNRAAWQSNGYQQRSYNNGRPGQERSGYGTQPMRSAGVTRFGPQAVSPQQREEQTRRGYGPQAPVQNSSVPQEAASAPMATETYNPDRYQFDTGRYETNGNENGITGMASDLLANFECPEVQGILEMHPEGYGFLRGKTFLPSSKDIYVSVAQIRRFVLRGGDLVKGKVRPLRDSDKFAAMLVITSVNGKDPDSIPGRTAFEDLTAVYSNRRIDLDSHSEEKLDDMRMVDLIAPLGFGQRALLLCQPDSGKTRLLQNFARVIHTNYPEAKVLAVLLNKTPEDATAFREMVGNCPVAVSTFDQPAENHLRMCDLVLERAMRFVEDGKDVVLLIDSLTTITKIFPGTAQQLRSVGMINPNSLSKAKKMFASARNIRQGGSLTVIAAMDIDTDNPADSTLVGEFRSNANMVLQLDASVTAAGVYPAFDLKSCATRNVEMLLSDDEMEGMRLIRQILGNTPNEKAIPQLLEMLHTVDSNVTFLKRIKEWAALMNASN